MGGLVSVTLSVNFEAAFCSEKHKKVFLSYYIYEI